jgi:hypothetical protein
MIRLIALTLTFLLAAGFVVSVAGEQGQSQQQEKPALESGKGRAYLGLGVGSLPPSLTAQLPGVISNGRGVLIEHVMKGSPAEEAGLKAHDILISFDKQDVYSPEQLVKLVRNSRPQTRVVLGYVRAGQAHEVTVQLRELPAPEAAGGEPGSRATWRAFQGKAEQRERDRQNDPVPWATFKSLTISKLEGGKYKAEVDFRDKDEKVLHREYVGTRKEIRKAILEDKGLPKDEKEHLLRSLDQQTLGGLRFGLPPALQELFEQDRFDWPSTDF